MTMIWKEKAIHKLVEDALRAVEEEHGLWGIDCVAHLINCRRRAIIAELMKERGQVVNDDLQGTDLSGQ